MPCFFDGLFDERPVTGVCYHQFTIKYGLAESFAQVIDDNNVVAGLTQLTRNVITGIPSAAGNKDLPTHYTLPFPL